MDVVGGVKGSGGDLEEEGLGLGLERRGDPLRPRGRGGGGRWGGRCGLMGAVELGHPG